MILAADISYRRGKRIGLRSIVQEAISGLEAIDKVVVLRRSQPPLELDLHEMDFYELVHKQSADFARALLIFRIRQLLWNWSSATALA